MIDVAFASRFGTGGCLTWAISLAKYLQSQGLTVQMQGPQPNKVACEWFTAAGIEFAAGPITDAKVSLFTGRYTSGGKSICVRHARRNWKKGWVAACKAADEVVAVSLPVAVNTKKMTGRDPIVINNGVDVERLDQVGEDLRETLGCKFLFGFVGRNVPLKNAKTIAAAAKQMHEYAIMAGHGVSSDMRLQNEWTRLMDYTGTPGDVYRAADVICVPSDHEAFPYCVVEALCLGRRVVVSKKGCCPEFGDMVTRMPQLPRGRQVVSVAELVTSVKLARAGPAPDKEAARELFGLPMFYKKWLQLLERYL